MHLRGPRNQSGVTLVELLAVMVILSISLAVVVPSMSKHYESWIIRAAGHRTVALFRLASDTARRGGTTVAAYYADHRFVLLRRGSILRDLQLPESIMVHPDSPYAVVFLPSGQIVAPEAFVLENSQGRKVVVEFGSSRAEITIKEEMVQ